MPLTNRSSASISHDSPSATKATWKNKSTRRGGFLHHNAHSLPHVALVIMVVLLLTAGSLTPRQLDSAAIAAGDMFQKASTPQTSPKRLDRVYCMVPFIWNAEVHDEIMNTWGKRCNVIRFMIDPIIGDEKVGYTDLRETPDHPLHKNSNIVVINMTRPWNTCGKEPCRHIWEKMWRSWVWVDETEKDMAEWFVKVDYDTFFFPENLVHFVRDQRGWKSTEDHYFGHKLYRNGKFPFAVGAANMLSKATLEKLAEVYRTMPSNGNNGERGRCEDRAHATEEISTAICLKEHLGIEAEDTLDSENREHIVVNEVDNVLKWNRTEQGEWWFWIGKPNVGEMEECCAHRPIGLHHYKKRGQLQQLENKFYGPINDSNKDYKRLDETTKRYVDKVRKAMGIPASQVQSKVS